MVSFSASFWRLKGPRVTKILKLLKFRFARALGSKMDPADRCLAAPIPAGSAEFTVRVTTWVNKVESGSQGALGCS